MKVNAFVLFVFLGTACGMVGSDEPLMPFASDGVGAFEGASPIEVCLGTARIVAPTLATGATALCVSDNQPSQFCLSTNDCAGLERCICGRCIVEPCQGAGSCQTGEVCRGKRCTRACGTNSDCLSGERCISGGCARKCNSTNDCHHGERCDALDDVCLVSLCGSGGTCGAGSTCEAVAELGELGEPTFLGDEPIAFAHLTRNDKRAIYRAIVEAPLVWRVEPNTPVFDVPGETIVGAPSVLRRGADIELYAAIGAPSRIVRAISTDDGASFTLRSDPFLLASEPWENGSVGSPSVFEFRSSTYLFYEGGNGAGIGLANISSDVVIRTEPNPFLTPSTVNDPVFWRNVTAIGTPHALVHDDVVQLLFTGRGIEGFSAATENGALPADVNDSIGSLATADLQTFSLFPTGPVFARLVNLRAYLGEREASMRPLSTGFEMVFVSSDASGDAVTGLFRAAGRGGTN